MMNKVFAALSETKILVSWIVGLLFVLAFVFFPQKELYEWQLAHLQFYKAPGWVAFGVWSFRMSLLLDGILIIWLVRIWARWSANPSHFSGANVTHTQNLTPDFVDDFLTRHRIAIVTAIVILGAVLRFWGIGRDLWLDEVATVVSSVKIPWSEIIAAFPGPNHHYLNSILSYLSIQALGESAASVRLPAVLFGIAGIWAFYMLALRITRMKETLFATLIFAVSYHHIFFTQNSRGYSGFLFGAVLGTAFLISIIQNYKPVYLIGYVLSMTVAFYSHLNALFVFAGQMAAFFLYLLWNKQLQRQAAVVTKRVLLAGVLTGFLTFQLYALVLPEMASFYMTAEAPNVGWNIFSLKFYQVFLEGLSLGFQAYIGIGFFLLLMGSGFLSYLRQSLFLALAFVMPAVVGLGLVLAWGIGIYPRFFLFLLPIGILIAVRGAHVLAVVLAMAIPHLRRMGPALEVSFISAAVLLSGFSLIRYYQLPKQNYREALAYIDSMKHNGDKVVAVDLAILGCRYYQPGILTADSLSKLKKIESSGQPVWVLYTFPELFQKRDPQLYEYIQSHFSTLKVFPGTVRGGAIFVNKEEIESAFSSQ